MTIDQLLTELAHRKVLLAVVDAELRVRAPAGAVDDELRRALAASKTHLVEMLSERARVVAKTEDERHEARFDNLEDVSLADFMNSGTRELAEVESMNQWLEAIRVEADGAMVDLTHLSAPGPSVKVDASAACPSTFLSFTSFNYLGYGSHPEVVQGAKQALETYGLGAAASPVLGGKLGVHRELEQNLVAYFGRPASGVTLFSSGYSANLGAISALLNEEQFLVCDRKAHMSIIDGGRLANAKIRFFDHNDPQALERVLKQVRSDKHRTIVAVEGVYSISGAFGRLAEIAEVTKRLGAYLLVDEAHSMLLTGPGGRGVAAAQGVLDQVDLLVLTLSKSFGGVGGAVFAREELTNYLNWFARCRMFSTALDPAVVGGLAKVPALAASPDGDARRARLIANARRLRSLLRGHVVVGEHDSWVVPVHLGAREKSKSLGEWLQWQGLEVGVVAYPAVPKDATCLRLFVTSEHTDEQLSRAASILRQGAQLFGFGCTDNTAPQRGPRAERPLEACAGMGRS